MRPPQGGGLVPLQHLRSAITFRPTAIVFFSSLFQLQTFAVCLNEIPCSVITEIFAQAIDISCVYA